MTFHRQRLRAVCFSCTPYNLVSHADGQHARTRAKRTHAHVTWLTWYTTLLQRGRYREPLSAKVKIEAKLYEN